MDEVLEMAKGVVSAIREPGKYPWYHEKMCRKLEREWPTLWHAILDLEMAVEKKN
jgi:hypothetical protein